MNLKENLADLVGKVWNSETLKQKFRVLSGPESLPGLGEWKDHVFVGYKAQRIGDGRLAIVALTTAPPKYSYDFVLID